MNHDKCLHYISYKKLKKKILQFFKFFEKSHFSKKLVRADLEESDMIYIHQLKDI
jgi:hypothetical protein